MSPWRIAVLGALLVPVLAIALIAGAWAVDTHDDHAVRRGIDVAGSDVGGRSRAGVTTEVRALGATFERTPVTVADGSQPLRTTAKDLGLAVDVDATVAAVMATGHHDPGILAPLRWIRAIVAGRGVPLRLRLDRNVAGTTLARLQGDRLTPPVEPRLTVKDGQVAMVPGSAGGGLDIEGVLDQLPDEASSATTAIRITAANQTTRPSLTDVAVGALADRANAITRGRVTIQAGSTPIVLDGADLRAGFSVTVAHDTPTLALDPALVARLLSTSTTTSATNPTGVTFALANGQMTPVPGHDAVVCCSPDAPATIVAGLLAGHTTIQVPTTTQTAAQGVQWAAGLGVKEVIGEFTTHHPAGQPRVKNIHRIADIVRGTLIPPGQTFSVNGFVGQRTTAKGFVVAPVIDEGQFSTDVGGGVSQFATTLFNAAFFGGLDIPEHKAHSIYISRYPFGREATLAYPSVDLKIHNNTPYGVVIWPTYTDSSLTVQLWSTRFAAGAQTAQSRSSGCGHVTTTRTRLFVDGHTDQQTYVADYSCNPPKE